MTYNMTYELLSELPINSRSLKIKYNIPGFDKLIEFSWYFSVIPLSSFYVLYTCICGVRLHVHFEMPKCSYLNSCRYHNTIECYDAESDKWHIYWEMPTSSSWLSCVTVTVKKSLLACDRGSTSECEDL